MSDLLQMVGFAIDWAMRHPHYVAAAAVGIWLLRWLLNRKSRLARDSEKTLDLLQKKHRGKYDDLRPLR